MTAEVGKGKTETGKYNEATLANLYEEYYDKIARYAYTCIGDRAGAEDLAGEVFLRALESLKSYQERGIPMQAWLFKIAHNLVIDHLRKTAKRQTVPIDTVQIESDADPMTIADTNIEFEKVTVAMRQLTQQQREILRLRFFGGLTSKEVGDILNKSDGAVREMQRSTIEKLRKVLVKDY
jgi:RNA polymerase sigma-70 factor (ECF subfamily)